MKPANDSPYPRFPPEEFENRRSKVRAMMRENDLEVLLVYGDSGFNQHSYSNVYYLSNYLDYGACYVVFFADPARDSTLFYQIGNHGQYAKDQSVIDDVRWGGPNITDGVIERVTESGLENGRIGLVGIPSRLIPQTHYAALDGDLDGNLIDVTNEYAALQFTKSAVEIEWLKEGARLTDLAMEALINQVEPGMTEYELQTCLESAYTTEGGRRTLTFLTSAPMEGAQPGQCIPWKTPSARAIQNHDIILNELSAAYGTYGGQIHRPIVVGRSPTSTYQDLYDIALEVYENMLAALEPGNTAQDIVAASAPAVNSPYKMYDVNLHGWGQTLQPPFIGLDTEHSNFWPAIEDPVTANWEFKAGQVMVVQPNLVTDDERMAMQLGTTAVIRDDGPEVIHDIPVRFFQV